MNYIKITVRGTLLMHLDRHQVYDETVCATFICFLDLVYLRVRKSLHGLFVIFYN